MCENEKRAYSQSKGSIELYMVGSNYGHSALGSYHPTTLPAILKLYNLKNSTTVSELITEKLKSLSTSENDPNFFKPIHVILLLRRLFFKCSVMELGYFDEIRIDITYQKLPIEVSGLKYEYTIINKAKKLCQRKKKKKSTDEATYLYPLSWDISFFEGYIKGRIETIRHKSDPLHYKPLDVSSSAYETTIIEDHILWMAVEIVMFTLSARSSTSNHNGIQNESWVAEKEVMFVALPLYVGGALITMFVTWRKSDYDRVLLTSSLTSYYEHHVWDALKSYCGLVLDGFLLPQILLNIFKNARENALSCSFYIGTTFVHLLPHAYDLYTTQTSVVHYIDMFYIFVNHILDFYSTAWDVVISFGGLLFASIVFLQQRFGSRCILTCTF
ncbi:hypothetical protein FNV43_RR16805 [Rhamnella rubrinervis]|uniref:RING-type E3 ubiquitin transferase n=1 Tax=Rhamnella rubrinervis TaxID=2594499 RepID=A0A8K0GZG2_9ROSA|nr:hypothetical protein FNV43_RR16805 [Rhamnella rubrinervis]